MKKAIFFDRDGVINEMIFDTENGIVHTPLNPNQIILTFGICDLLKKSKEFGYLNIVISNQANIGLGRITLQMHDSIIKTVHLKLLKENAVIDKEYYCFHHPFGKIEKYAKNCECRKPKTGLFLKAAKEMDIDLTKSWLIGDGVSDIVAGHNAGCKTILITNIYETGYLRKFEEKLGDIKPDFMVKQIKEIIPIISSNS